MKRFLSLFIALILAFSMFAVTAIAFAQDDVNDGDEDVTPSHEVSFDADAFKSYVYDNQLKMIEMSKTFMLDGKVTITDGDEEKEKVWFKDYNIVHEIFPGIRCLVLEDEDIVDIDPDASEDGGYSAAGVTPWDIFYVLNLPKDAKVSGNSQVGDNEEGEDGLQYYKFVRYQKTEIVTLEKAPTLTNYRFAGWDFSWTSKYEDKLPAELKLDYLFEAGFKFNMPEAMITATAKWEKIATDDDNKSDETPDDPDVEEETLPDIYANDELYILYTGSDSKEEMDKWDRCLVTDTFSVTTTGPWAFRFAVADGSKTSEKDHTFDWDDDILVTTFDNVLDEIEKGEMSEQQLLAIDYTLRCIAEDTTCPEVKLSTSMKNKVSEGLTVGTTYSISTALDIEDASSTRVTYVVYKMVNGAWKQIFDSAKSEVAEGYEENISKSGVITPLDTDVKADKAHVYKIEYTVTDAYGYVGIHVDKDAEGELTEKPTMLLFVNAKPVAPKSMTAIDAWKIVLYVIAGLSAVGIIVLIFIKPKQETAADGRYNASSDGETNGEQEGNSDKE
ncbi:MAG: hypothetical protein J1G02_04915 [Clostridiales bacterium]|nr:hypothetical protein [Clostridiales bacterium]